MKNHWLAFAVFALFSSGVFAESIKTESSSIKRFECDSESLIVLATNAEHPILNGDRLPLSGAGKKYIFYIGDYTQTDADKLTISIEETRRKSHIEDDVAQIAAYLKSQVKMLETFAEKPKHICIEYTTAFERSTIAIQIDSKPPINRSFIAGPEEHWSLSADMPVTNAKQLSYNPQTSSLVEKDKPVSFYLGLNYKLGDVYTNYDCRDWHNLSAKFLFKASNTPNESMGLGIGYSFDFADVFIARVWTRDNENTGLASLGTTPSTMYGISFNVSKAISWLKK
ncbi:MAG: hypothetical protein PHQ60_14445 [Sideroxydans sp.]|nr:hypothetical protein [Sideroxydans sp.]